MKLVLSLLAVVLMVGVAEARPRRGYTYNAPQQMTHSYTGGHMDSGSDQDRCQQEADYMAAHGISGHVGSCIGSFEGCGCGPTPDCGTCTPSRPMGLTGDACAQGRNGLWYRVRSWR